MNKRMVRSQAYIDNSTGKTVKRYTIRTTNVGHLIWNTKHLYSVHLVLRARAQKVRLVSARLEKNPRFYPTQANWIVLTFSKLKALNDAQRVLRQTFFPNHLRFVPGFILFQSLNESSKATGAVWHLPCPRPLPRVKNRPRCKREQSRVLKFFSGNPYSRISNASEELGIFFDTV